MKRALLPLLAVVSPILVACGGSSLNTPAPAPRVAQFAQNADIWTALGGDTKAPAVVAKVVNDAVTGLLSDPKEAPYFAVLGKPGHDTAGRLVACLNLQFNAVLGGPYTYPGQVVADGNYVTCEDMTTAHSDTGIPSCVFDQFITDLAAVLKQDGLPDPYIARVAPTLVGLKGNIVSSMPMYLGPNTAANCS